MFTAPATFLLAALWFAPAVNGQTEDETAHDLLHSDLPIFGRGGENEWPQRFQDQNSLGCASRVAFGDWTLRQSDAEGQDHVTWYRFSNYGAFHCWANTQRAHDRARLDGADARPSFFVLLDRVSVAGRDVQLWAVQMGARPGSQYLLLSRERAPGRAEKFDVLQIACPAANVRNAGTVDILLTRYCAVNTRSELLRLARLMVQRPPFGVLARVPPDDSRGKDRTE